MMEPLSQEFWPGAPRQPGHEVPSVAPPALGAPAAEGVDTSAPRFLAAAALNEVRKLEEEAARRKVKEAEEAKAKEERLAKAGQGGAARRGGSWRACTVGADS